MEHDINERCKLIANEINSQIRDFIVGAMALMPKSSCNTIKELEEYHNLVLEIACNMNNKLHSIEDGIRQIKESSEVIKTDNKIAIEKSIVDCIEKKLNKMKECLKKGYGSSKREDLCQLCIYEEKSVNEFLAWDEKNGTTPLGGTKSDLVEHVIKAMNKNSVDIEHCMVDVVIVDAIVEWLSEQFDMDLEHVLWYFSF